MQICGHTWIHFLCVHFCLCYQQEPKYPNWYWGIRGVSRTGCRPTGGLGPLVYKEPWNKTWKNGGKGKVNLLCIIAIPDVCLLLWAMETCQISASIHTELPRRLPGASIVVSVLFIHLEKKQTNRRVYHIVTDHAFWVESIVTYHRIYQKKCIT